MMNKENNTTITGCSLCFQVTASILIFASATTIITLMYTWGIIGWIGTSAFTAGTCTNNYFSTKYGQMELINQTVTVGSSVATIMGLIMLFIMISFVSKNCKGELNPTGCARGCVFFTWSIIIMGIIPVVGYYLSFFIEFGQCTNNTLDITQTLIIIGLSGIVLLFSLLACLISSCQSCGIKQERESIYKQVRRQLTQPYDQQAKKKPYSRSPLRRQQEVTRQKMDPYQQTVYQSPYKKIRDVRQEEQQYPVRHPPKYNQSPREAYNKKLPYYNGEENVITNLHPNLRGIDPLEYVQREKNFKKYQSQDRQFFKKQQDKYFEQYDRRGILSRGEPYSPEKSRQYPPRQRDYPPRQRDYPPLQRQVGPRFDRRPQRHAQQRNYPLDRDYIRNQDDRNYDYEDRQYDRRAELRRPPERRRDYNDRIDSDYQYPSLDYRNHSPPVRQGMMRNYIRNR